MQSVTRIANEEITTVQPKPEATTRFSGAFRRAARKTVWLSGCRSWYLDRNGVPYVWPWTIGKFRRLMRRCVLADYESRADGSRCESPSIIPAAGKSASAAANEKRAQANNEIVRPDLAADGLVWKSSQKVCQRFLTEEAVTFGSIAAISALGQKLTWAGSAAMSVHSLIGPLGVSAFDLSPLQCRCRPRAPAANIWLAESRIHQ